MSYKGVLELRDLEQLEYYYKNNEIDMDQIIEEFSSYITTIINNGTNDKISYLAGITRNLIKEKYRKLKIVYDIDNWENDVSVCVNMYENDRELILDIEKKIKGLKKIDIEIVNLFYYSSMSIKDIAKRLHISELNVKTRLHRIRKKIKRELNSGRF